jgi:hypothetical protein
MASVDELNPALPTETAGTVARRAQALLAKPAAVFLVLSLVFGALTLIITPPLRGPDEPAHFFRIYAIARGEIIPSTADANGRKGMFLPHRLYQDFEFFEAARLNTEPAQLEQEGSNYRKVLREYLQRPPPPDGPPVFVHYSGSEGYNPASYLPFIAAALLARLGDLDFVPALFLMRIFGLIATTAVAAYAIAIVPRLGWTFLFIAMLPASLYGRAMVSPDGGALAYTMVVTALCLRAAHKLDAGKLWQQSSWMALCALSKPPQLAFILLAAMTKSPRQLLSHWRASALIALPALILSVAWVTMGSVDVASWRLIDEAAGLPKEQFDPIWKLRYLLEHPLHFPTQMIANVRDIDWLWWQMIGILGWLDTGLRAWVYSALSIILISVCFTRLELDRPMRHWVALVAGLSVLGYVLALYLIFYLVWTPIGSDHVQGVQGRYFIMAIPVAALVLAAAVNRGPTPVVTAVLAIAGAILSGGAVVEAILRTDWPSG